MAYFEPHANSKKTRYYISYKVDGKRMYVFDEVGDIISFDKKENAKKYILSQRINEDAKNIIKKQRELVLKKYGNHFDFLKQYLKERSKKAKYSWERSEYHMLHYVFLYFLFMNKNGNAKTWSLHFKSFKVWLEDEATTIKKNAGEAKLSISSMNKIIADLNGYIKFYHQETHIDSAPAVCEYFAGVEDGYRTGEDVVSDEEFDLVTSTFDSLAVQYKEKGLLEKAVRTNDSKELYIVCRATGMRLSEAMGISYGDFHPYPVKDKNLEKIISSHGLDTIGYIVLKSQVVENKKDKKVIRKALKTKKDMSWDNSRVIPIFKGQEDCFDILVRRMLNTQKHFNIKSTNQIKLNEGQYLFFKNINKNIASNKLLTIYNILQRKHKALKWKSFHCLRHTRASEIISLTHNSTLVKLILGHQSKVYERYFHLEAMLSKKLSSENSMADLLNFQAKKSS